LKKEFTLETFKGMIDKVVAWNAIGGNLPTDNSLETIYLTLSREEAFSVNEFLQGWFNKDWEMVADGLADLTFTAGFLSCIVGSDFSRTAGIISTVDEAVANLTAGLINFDSFSKKYLGGNLFRLCEEMSEFMDVQSVFDRVNQSNLSKYVHESVLHEGFCLDGEVQHIESQERYSGVDWKQVGEYFVFTAGQDVKSGVVFDTPKVVKSSRFVDVEELGGLLEFVY
jgi:hypothetical protein